MSPNRIVTSAELDSLVERLILGRPMPSGRRLLGVEYEQLVLDRRTRASAPLDFCRTLMTDLVADLGAEPIVEGSIVKGLRATGFEMSMEPGGQMEIATPPCDRIDGVDLAIRAAIDAMDARLRDTNFELVGLGHAPVTPVAELGLLPRERYRIMDARMPTRGPLSRNMMRATAGFQLTYDVRDRDDAGRKLALLYRFSPLLLAISANSRTIEGKDSGFASFRHHVWLETDRDRSGVPPGCLHAETAIDGYVRYALAARVMFLARDGVVVAAPDEPLADLVEQGLITEADVDLHLTGLFPFVRLRNYLEVRCFDALPWAECRGVLALVSGLIYCDEAFAAAQALSDSFVVEDSEALRALHEDAARRGLDAVAVDRRPFREIARQVAAISRSTLGGDDCAWAQLEDLEPIVARIEST